MAKKTQYTQHREGDRRYVTHRSGRTIATFQAKQKTKAKALARELNGK